MKILSCLALWHQTFLCTKVKYFVGLQNIFFHFLSSSFWSAQNGRLWSPSLFKVKQLSQKSKRKKLVCGSHCPHGPSYPAFPCLPIPVYTLVTRTRVCISFCFSASNLLCDLFWASSTDSLLIWADSSWRNELSSCDALTNSSTDYNKYIHIQTDKAMLSTFSWCYFWNPIIIQSNSLCIGMPVISKITRTGILWHMSI